MNKIFKKMQFIDDLPDTKRKLITDVFFALLVFYVASFAINLIDLPLIMIVIFEISIGSLFKNVGANGIISNSSIYEQLSTIRLPVWHTIVSLFLFFFITLFVIIFRKYVDLGTCKSLGMKKKTFFKHYGIGLIIGTFLLVISTCFDVLIGSATNLHFGEIKVGDVFVIIIYFFGFAVQSMAEELLCRGFLLTNIARKHKPITAILVSSIFFTLLHVGNPGYGLFPLLSIFLFGILMGTFVYYTGDIWMACGIHCAWNFTLTNLVAPTEVSVLGSDNPSIFLIDLTTSDQFRQSISSIFILGLTIAVLFAIMIVQYKKEKQLASVLQESDELTTPCGENEENLNQAENEICENIEETSTVNENTECDKIDENTIEQAETDA